jgi:hypothetical protein
MPCRVERAESLASGHFRRGKFWPRRYRCERGILEVLDDFYLGESDDFPDRQNDSDQDDSVESRWFSFGNNSFNANQQVDLNQCMVYDHSPLPFLMPVRQAYRVKIPRKETRQLKELRKLRPKMLHRVQSRYVSLALISAHESVYSSDSESGIVRDMINLFKPPN